jgi:hypothetical protein
MWLMLCSPQDLPALWAYRGLKAQGLEPLELVADGTLSCSIRWEHRLTTKDTLIDITLADGRIIRHDSVRGIINRLSYLVFPQLELGKPAERDYASQELLAFFMSWLHAMPRPVLNRPKPPMLSGQWRQISEWVWLAGKAGLPAAPYKKSSRSLFPEQQSYERVVPYGTPVKTVITVMGTPVDSSLPQEIRQGCRLLAQLAGTELFGIEFANGPAGPWTFAGATLFPDFRLGGSELLEALKSILQGGEK